MPLILIVITESGFNYSVWCFIRGKHFKYIFTCVAARGKNGHEQWIEMTHEADCIVMSLLMLQDNVILHVSIRLVSFSTHGHTNKCTSMNFVEGIPSTIK